MYDYSVIDSQKNKKKYGRYRVPMLPIHRINDTTIPIHIFTGERDDLTTPEDVHWIKKALPRAVRTLKSYIDLDHYNIMTQPLDKSQIKPDVLKALKESGVEPKPWPEWTFEEISKYDKYQFMED